MTKLLIFPTPLDSQCVLTLDNGTTIIGKPDTHSSGRPGQSFIIPDGSPSGNGCQLVIDKPTYVRLLQRGILMIGVGGESSYIIADDFHLALEKVCPPCPDPIPIPPIPPTPGPNPNRDPFTIITEVYDTGKFNLKTKEGCGKFTEECTRQLHVRNSNTWGHIRKFPPQNNYNGHAVDACQLLVDKYDTKAGVYDIIYDSEGDNAKPAFNFKGPPNPDLWYYPVV